MSLKRKFISCLQDQSDISILEEVVKQTKTVINTRKALTRCIKCSADDTSFDVPIEAYRIIYRAQAKFKQFYDAKIGEIGNEENEKDFAKVEIMNGFEIFDNYTFMRISGVEKNYTFRIDGYDDTVTDDCGEVKNFKTLTNLYDNLALKTVRFCHNCAVFF